MGALDSVPLIHQWPAWPGREPAQVRLGHAEGALHLVASIPDEFVTSKADGPNQRLWQLGDTFEMFLQALASDDVGYPIKEYFEFHVAPSGFQLQLRFPSEAEFKSRRAENPFEEYLLPDPAFQSEAEIIPSGWRLWACVPAEIIERRPGPLAGHAWRFSFCRYDYSGIPGDPVLSSTSDYRELDFHRLADWGVLRFE